MNGTHPLSRCALILPLGTWVALACYLALVIPFLGYVPIWDSMDYLDNYLFLPRSSLSLQDFFYTPLGHPAFGYYWPFWIGQWLFPNQLLLVQAINLLIGSLGIVAFGGIATAVFRSQASRLEIGLLTVAFAVHPIYIAYALNMLMDYGVIAYFLAILWLLYANRLKSAALMGIMLLFCKETGILFFTLLVVFYLSGAIRAYTWKRSWPLAVPYAAFAVFWGYRKSMGADFSPWAKNWIHESIWHLYVPNPFSMDLWMAFLGPFVLEFQWIFTAVIAIGLIAGACARRPAALKDAGLLGWFQKIKLPLRSFGFLLLGTLYIVSREVPFTNQRYFLPLYPLVLLCFFAALVQLRLRGSLRTAVMAGAVVLLAACNFRTLDPVSKAITGTLRFGRHDLLSIASVRPDFGDLNRDELIYNLEHLEFAFLMDKALEKIKPTAQTPLVLEGDAWLLLDRIDAHTYHRTESLPPAAIKVNQMSVDGIAGRREKLATIDLLELPYFRNAQNEAKLAPFYNVKDRLIFSTDGYEISVLEMTRK
jgi:hypothetical protein